MGASRARSSRPCTVVDERRWKVVGEGEGEVVDVAVDHIELLSAVGRHPDLEQMGRDRVRRASIEPQGTGDRSDELRGGSGIAAREACDFVLSEHQFLDPHRSSFSLGVSRIPNHEELTGDEHRAA
jgi:hypothetical protein